MNLDNYAAVVQSQSVRAAAHFITTDIITWLRRSLAPAVHSYSGGKCADLLRRVNPSIITLSSRLYLSASIIFSVSHSLNLPPVTWLFPNLTAENFKIYICIFNWQPAFWRHPSSCWVLFADTRVQLLVLSERDYIGRFTLSHLIFPLYPSITFIHSICHCHAISDSTPPASPHTHVMHLWGCSNTRLCVFGCLRDKVLWRDKSVENLMVCWCRDMLEHG